MFADTHMRSPSPQADGPVPSLDELQGASRTVGGHICGHAHGNVFNIGDGHEDVQDYSSHKGKVHLFTDIGAYDRGEQSCNLIIPVNSTLKPILQDIAKKWPPITSMSSLFNLFTTYLSHMQREIHISLYGKVENGLLKVHI
jgi:hypothetical protein